ncbi:MAG: hypothetical protein ACRQFF_02555 [Sphaerochaeta sp.]
MTKFLKEDAMHIDFPINNRDKEFEWWYFDAALDNGDHFVVMYSTNDTRLKPRRPSVRTNIYEHNGNEIKEILDFKETEVSFDYSKCDAKFGDQYCIDQGDHFEIYTNINGNGAHLMLYPQKPSWTRPSKGKMMGWTVAVPCGKIEGVLFKNGKEVPVKGTGYHDHNWGSEPMGNQFSNWYWGKVHTDDISIDYGVMIPINPKKKPIVSLLAFDNNSAIVQGSMKDILFNNSVEVNKVSKEPVLGFNIAHQLKINVNKIGFKLDLVIDLKKIVMRDKAQFKGSESAYRYIGDEVMKVKRNGTTKTYKTSSLHEIVFLGPVG